VIAMTFDIPAINTDLFANGGPRCPAIWLAFYADDEPNDAGCMANGEGPTETQAIADLIENHPRSEK
jgi:hypothetical protein